MSQVLPPEVGAPAPGGPIQSGNAPPPPAAGPQVGVAPPALRPIVDRDKFNAAVTKVQSHVREQYGYAMPLEQAEKIVQGDPTADMKIQVRIKTLAAQREERDAAQMEAGLTGEYNGNPTLESRRVSAVEEQNKIAREQIAENARQFDTTELRLADNFAKTYGLSREEFLEVVRKNKAGEAIEDSRLKQAADQFEKDLGLRRDTLALDREQFAESTRQFNVTYNQRAEEFAQTLGLSKAQFEEVVRSNRAGEEIEDRRLKQAADQFEKEMGLRRDDLGLRREEFEATKEERKAAQARWQKEFDASVDQFTKTFGLDSRRFEEGIRQYNEGMELEDKKLQAQIEQFYAELGLSKEELAFRKDSFDKEFSQRAEQWAAEFGLTKEQFAEQVRQFEAGHALANRELEIRIDQFETEMSERREVRLENMRQFNQTYQQRADEFAQEIGLRKETFLETVRQFNAGQEIDYARLRIDQQTLEETIRQFNDKMDLEREQMSWQDSRDEKDYLRKVYLTELAASLDLDSQEADRQWRSAENYLQREHEADLQDTRLTAEQRIAREQSRNANMGVLLRGAAHFIEQKYFAADDFNRYMASLDRAMGNTGSWGSKDYWKGLGFSEDQATKLSGHFTANKPVAMPGSTPPAGTPPAGTPPAGNTPPVGAPPPGGTPAGAGEGGNVPGGNSGGGNALEGAAAAGAGSQVPGAGAPPGGTLPSGQTAAPGTNPDNLAVGAPAPGPDNVLPGDAGVGGVPKGNQSNLDPEIGLQGPVPETPLPGAPQGPIDWNRLKGSLTPRNMLTFGLQFVGGAWAAKNNIAAMGDAPVTAMLTDAAGFAQAVAGGPVAIAGYLSGRLAEGMSQWYGGGRQEFWAKTGFQLPGDTYARTLASPEIIQQMGGAEQFSGNRIVPFVNFQTGEVVWDKGGGQAQIKESLEAFMKRNNAVPLSFYGAEDETWESFPPELRQKLGFKPSYAVVNKDGSILFLEQGSRQDRKSVVIEPDDAKKYFPDYTQSDLAQPPGTNEQGVDTRTKLFDEAMSVRGLSRTELNSIVDNLPDTNATMFLRRLASGASMDDIAESGIFRNQKGEIISPTAWSIYTGLRDSKRIPYQTSAAAGD